MIKIPPDENQKGETRMDRSELKDIEIDTENYIEVTIASGERYVPHKGVYIIYVIDPTTFGALRYQIAGLLGRNLGDSGAIMLAFDGKTTALYNGNTDSVTIRLFRVKI